MKKLLLPLALLASIPLWAQNVGIGTTNPQFTLTVKDSTGANGYKGFAQVSPDGLVAVGTYVSNGSAYIQTHTNDDLHFSTNDDLMQLTLQKNTGNFGIGNNDPQAKLDVNGTMRLADGTQGAGKVLTSDAAGYATWATPQSSITLPYSGTNSASGPSFSISNDNGDGIAVSGYSTGSGKGINGITSGGSGVYGSANSGLGVEGYSNTGTAGYFSSNAGLALKTGTGGVEINGNMKITSGSPAAGKVLTSDASGNATWQSTAPKATSFVSFYQDAQLALPTDGAISGALPYSDASDVSGFDNGNNFINGVFTAPTAGMYHFSYEATITTMSSNANQQGNISLFLMINGNNYRDKVVRLHLSDPIPITIGDAADFYLNAGDVVDVRISETIGTTIYFTASNMSHFVGYKVY